MTALDDAWQAALAAEHQAVFGYGVLGPHLAKDDLPLAYAGVAAHEDLRDATLEALTTAGRTPVAPRADYPALYPVTDAAAARRLAVRLEEDCAAAWRYLYLRAASAGAGTAGAVVSTGASASAGTGAAGSAGTGTSGTRATGTSATTARLRATAQAALTASAVRAVRWRARVSPAAASVPFPGA
jgi:hypothetical protein